MLGSDVAECGIGCFGCGFCREPTTQEIPRETMREVQLGASTQRARTLEMRPLRPEQTVSAMARLRAYMRAEGLVLCRAPDTSYPLADDREDVALAALTHAIGL